MLKNVERMSRLQGFAYTGASIAVTAEREDNPAALARIRLPADGRDGRAGAKDAAAARNIAKQGHDLQHAGAVLRVTGELATLRPVASGA